MTGSASAFARELRSRSTDGERLLWSRLRAHRLFGLKFRRQQPIGRYTVDFVCMDRRVIVELDGGQHADETAYDSARDAWLREQGFIVMRFWNTDVMTNADSVLELVARACGVLTNDPLSPGPSPAGGEGSEGA